MDRLPCGVYFESYEEDMAVAQTMARKAVAIGFVALLFCIPLVAGERIVGIINTMAITVIAVQGLSILTGGCGQISLGHAAFMAVGAYTSGYLVGKCGLPFWSGLICAAVSSGLIGMVFGLPSLRIKGFYLILATVAAQLILVDFLPFQLKDITGGGYGLEVPPPEIAGFVLDSEKSMYFLIVGFAVLMTLFAKNIFRTKTGRAFIAVRDNDLAAAVMGISLYRYKLLAFFIGCLYAGIAGSLFAHYTGHVDPGFFTLDNSIWYLGMIIVGGIGSTAGAVMGTVFFSLIIELTIEIAPLVEQTVPFLSRSGLASLSLVIPGAVIILFLIFEPRGLYHRWQIIKAYFQVWPYAH
jgi:branched-chain amino acid transport system permease protein